MPSIEPDGLGFNPILQDIGLAIHPPILYLGYLGFSVPFSLSIADSLQTLKEMFGLKQLGLGYLFLGHYLLWALALAVGGHIANLVGVDFGFGIQ
uniref:cytochrome c biogenesis protein CcsA n=1 Tax=Wolbachia endosymbiont of Atemnus politus TaxID=2682840 RepID=UPI002103AACC|nr:cytochrome c biogenesis protein CcsA [Wolbachia endosymbiont of Atemnus politus]